MQSKTLTMARLTLIVIWATLSSCSSTKGAKQAATVEADQFASPIHQSVRGGEKVTEFDLNHDGKPDVWAYTVKAKTPDGREYDKLVRKELDINFDGKVDVVRYYGEN